MYEKQVEEALVKWLPSYYSGPWRLVSIDQQVELPNGGRADVISLGIREGDEEQHAILDIWELKRGVLDIAAAAQVGTYKAAVIGFYYSHFLTSDFRPAHQIEFRAHLVGSHVTDHPILRGLQEFASLWTYSCEPSGIKFNRFDTEWPTERSVPPTLNRIVGSLAWKTASWVTSEGGK